MNLLKVLGTMKYENETFLASGTHASVPEARKKDFNNTGENYIVTVFLKESFV